MLKDVLGIIIDPEGNYLSFGKWLEEYEFDENYWMYMHISSLFMAIYQSGWYLSHEDLNLKDFYFQKLLKPETVMMMDEEVSKYLTQLYSLGYTLLLNRSLDKGFKIIIGFLPSFLTQEQENTLLFLKEDILFQTPLDSNIYVYGREEETISIYDLYHDIKSRKRSF